MERYLERELRVMLTYYKYMMDRETGFKKEYYRGKLEAAEFISTHIVLCSNPSIDYYVDFLKKKGIIRGCENCAKNPRINTELPDLPGCGADECYDPVYDKWVHKEMK